MTRYIDADLVKQIANAELGSSDKETVYWVIAHTPTADVQEVKHGKWKVCGLFDDFVKCSCCGYKEPSYHVFQNGFEYCPMCGAKMDWKE